MGMPVITPSGTPRCQAISDLIESVALQEAGLAHILNAEGEKLQKAISRADVSAPQLLQFNRSVEDTLRAVTQLEVILQGKLALFQDCLCSNCPTPPTRCSCS